MSLIWIQIHSFTNNNPEIEWCRNWGESKQSTLIPPIAVSLVSIIAGLINLILIEDIQSNQLISQPALMKQTSAMAASLRYNIN